MASHDMESLRCKISTRTSKTIIRTIVKFLVGEINDILSFIGEQFTSLLQSFFDIRITRYLCTLKPLITYLPDKDKMYIKVLNFFKFGLINTWCRKRFMIK